MKQFIFASSGAVLGEVVPPAEDMPTRPKSIWCHQTCWRKLLSGICQELRFGTVAQFSNVYGPYSNKKNSVVAKFIKSAMAKQPLTINGTGAQTRLYFCQDLVEALIACMNKPLKGFNLFQIFGTGHQLMIFEQIATCSVHLGQMFHKPIPLH